MDLNRDGDGFLINTNDWSEEVMQQMAEADGAKIKYIFLTHFHADFVSGQYDLARKTGAKIVFGPYATAEYNI